MKVLVVNTCGIAVGGITTNMLEYINALSDSNISFDILVTIYHEEDVILKFLNLGCKIINMPNRKKNPLGYAAKLNKLIKETRYDVIHVHGNSATMALELLIAKRNEIPIRIAHCHNNVCGHPFLHKILNPVFKSSYTTALACSQKAGEWIFGTKNFKVLPNAINANKYKFNQGIRENCRKELGVSESVKLCVFIGNLVEQKNPMFLIDIWKDFEKDSNYQLLIIGEGVLKEQIEKKIQSAGLENKIKLMGIRNDIEKIMQAADILLMPSKWEGLPMVLIEAQTTGLKCLVSDVVTDEACIDAHYFYKIPLNKKIWLEALEKCEFFSDRQHAYKKTVDAVYDIKKGAESLIASYKHN